jgi:hypothetical protein
MNEKILVPKTATDINRQNPYKLFQYTWNKNKQERKLFIKTLSIPNKIVLWFCGAFGGFNIIINILIITSGVLLDIFLGSNIITTISQFYLGLQLVICFLTYILK